jgi:hypothetical protein
MQKPHKPNNLTGIFTPFTRPNFPDAETAIRRAMVSPTVPSEQDIQESIREKQNPKKR